MNSRYFNQNYDGTDIPLSVGDRYYGQDRGRDFFNQREHAALVGNGIVKEDGNVILSGGFISQGAGHTIDITSGKMVVAFEVKNPTDWNTLPPPISSQDISILVEVPSLTNQDISSATTDNTTINYVKISYNENFVNARNRAKSTGSYNSEVQASYTLSVDSTVPTAYEITLQRFVTNGTTITFVGVEPRSTAETGYTKIAYQLDGSDIRINKPELEYGKRLYCFNRDLTFNLTSLTVDTWYVLTFNLSTYDFDIKLITDFSAWTSSPGFSGNSLDMYDALYDEEIDRCISNDGTNDHLILGTFYTNNNGGSVDDFQYKFYTPNAPLTHVLATRDTDQAMSSGSNIIDYSTIEYDLNSEYTSSVGFSAKFDQIMSHSSQVGATTAVTTREIITRIDYNGFSKQSLRNLVSQQNIRSNTTMSTIFTVGKLVTYSVETNGGFSLSGNASQNNLVITGVRRA